MSLRPKDQPAYFIYGVIALGIIMLLTWWGNM